jgi:hypothetical protein
VRLQLSAELHQSPNIIEEQLELPRQEVEEVMHVLMTNSESLYLLSLQVQGETRGPSTRFLPSLHSLRLV